MVPMKTKRNPTTGAPRKRMSVGQAQRARTLKNVRCTSTGAAPPMNRTELSSRVRPIVLETYGRSGMATALVGHLAERIAAYEGDDRERMVRDVCWNWFSGGTTAEGVARRIEASLND